MAEGETLRAAAPPGDGVGAKATAAGRAAPEPPGGRRGPGLPGGTAAAVRAARGRIGA